MERKEQKSERVICKFDNAAHIEQFMHMIDTITLMQLC